MDRFRRWAQWIGIAWGFSRSFGRKWRDLGRMASATKLADAAVVRDAARHAWQRELVQRLPDAIVVETGLPGGVDAAIETYGAGRANLQAAMEALGSQRAAG